MDLAILDDRKQRACGLFAVERNLDTLHRTAESFRLADMDVISGTCDGDPDIELRIVFPEERLNSQTVRREFNAEALEE